MTLSVGVALAEPGEHATADGLLRQADTAMYRAKQAGRNRHTLYDAVLRGEVVQRKHVEAVLRDAVAQERVVVHYQPVVNVTDRRTVGAEALVRILDDDGSLLMPGVFLDLAEQSGAMIAVEHVVLRKACLQGAAWQAAGHDLSVSVNVCARQMTAIEDFEAEVGKALALSGMRSDRLICEITEHTLLRVSDRTRSAMERMQASGIEFSVDDFGTGYASLTYLLDMPLQEVKVDRSFISRSATDPRAAAITRSVAAMATELGLRCVAEGVEDEQAHAFVAALGIERAQGYGYARPLSAEAFDAWLAG